MTLSNTLADMAERLKQVNDEASVAQRTLAEKAIEAGTLLSEAKGCCRHGEWLPFLERAGIAERQARRLMQIAGSGLKPDTVSDLGGIKATLDYLSRRKLPIAAEVLAIAREGWASSEERSPLMMVIPSKLHPGFFDVAMLDAEFAFIDQTTRPVKPEGVWVYLETVHPVSAFERVFIILPESVISTPSSHLDGSAMPESYLRAIAAIEACIKEFTPETYLAAKSSLRMCLADSERWPIEQRLLGIYHDIARDENLTTLGARVDRLARLSGRQAVVEKQDA